MVRAVLLIAVFVGLLAGSAMSEPLKDAMALGGIAGACVALNWLTERKR